MDWLAPLETGLCTLERPELATLVLPVIRGLIMDLDATGDNVRVDRAFAELLASLRERASGQAPTRRADAPRRAGDPLVAPAARPAETPLKRQL